jgi:hypothetical protein
MLSVEPIDITLGQRAVAAQGGVDLVPELLVLSGRVDVPKLVAARIGRQPKLYDLAQRNGRDRKGAMLASRIRGHDRETSLTQGAPCHRAPSSPETLQRIDEKVPNNTEIRR